MGYLPFLSRRFLLEQKTPQSFPTEAVFPRCHSASLFCTKSALIRIHLICAAMITGADSRSALRCGWWKAIESACLHVSMHPPLRPTPCALALPATHLGANPPEPIRCCRPRRRPTISDSLCRTEKQVLFSVTGLCDNHTRNLRACQALFAVFVLFFGYSPH